jgi:hypothetical protein
LLNEALSFPNGTNRERNRQTEILIDRQIEIEKEIQIKQLCIQKKGRQIDGQTDGRTDIRTDGEKGRWKNGRANR